MMAAMCGGGQALSACCSPFGERETAASPGHSSPHRAPTCARGL
jgi:uncharacterized protein YchJ